MITAAFKITPLFSIFACVPGCDTRFIVSRLIIHILELLPLSVPSRGSRISPHFGHFFVFHRHILNDLLQQKEVPVDRLCINDIIVVPWKFSIMLI